MQRLSALILALSVVLCPASILAGSSGAPLHYLGGAIGASLYGPGDVVNVSNLSVTSWAAVQVDQLFAGRDTARTWRFLAAFQYYQQHGNGTDVPDLNATGFKLLFSNDLLGLPGTVIVGGGFLNDVKASLDQSVSSSGKKSQRRGLIGPARARDSPADSAQPFAFSDGLEFDFGISWPLADHVDAIGLLMFIDKGELGTEVSGYFALGIRRPLSLLGIGRS